MKHRIFVFSSPTCPYCHQLMDFLRENKIEFKEVDVSKDHKAATEMVKRSGQTGVPVMIVDDKEIIIGFDKEKVKKVLGIK